MNRSRVMALVISLSAAAFGVSVAGCGGESSGEGVGGASTGTGGANAGGAGTAGGGGVTSDASHADVTGDASGVILPDASQDASLDQGRADAIVRQDSMVDAGPRSDAAPDAPNRDAATTDARDAGAPEIITVEAASPEAGPPEASAPEAGPPEASAEAAEPEEDDATVDTTTAPEAAEPDATTADTGGGPDPCEVSTEACIRSRDKSPTEIPSTRCYQCMFDNGCFDPAMQGGTCEAVPGLAPASCGAVLGTSSAPSEAQVCLFTLRNVLSSECAATNQQTPCLCGTADAAQCLAGTTPPLGPLFPAYQCDLGANVATIQTNFTVPMFGAGEANAIVQCAGAYGCNCF